MKEIIHKPNGLRKPFPRVGVVIVTWNRKDYVLRLLDTLSSNAYPNWQVLVVDNASTDGSAEAIKARHPWARCVVSAVNLGGSGGFNTGLTVFLDEGGYDYIWLLDNDVEVEPGALEVLVEALESDRTAAVAGSHMIQLDNDQTTNEIGADCNLDDGRLELCLHGSRQWFHRSEVYEVDYVAACSMLVRFDVMKKVGIMTDYFIHFDDVDWCLRFKEAGYRTIACAASRIRHLSGRSKRVTWILYYDVRNMLYLQERHGEFGRLFFIRAFAKAMGRGIRDEFSGKSYYCRLSELGWRDFLRGKTGRGEDMPVLQVKPAAEVIKRIMGEPGKIVFTLEPLIRPLHTPENMQSMTRNNSTLLALCHESGTGAGELPPDARRLLLPAGRLRRGLAMLKLLLAGPRPDYLILDIDKLCGFMGVCAKRIVLLVDDGCIEMPGGYGRIFDVIGRLFRWFALAPRFLVFILSGRRRGASPKTIEFQPRSKCC